MSDSKYHNHCLIAFVRSDSPRMVVYLKQNDQTKEFAVKVKHPDNTRTVVYASYSLSSAMREFAETIAQHTNGFSTWSKVY